MNEDQNCKQRILEEKELLTALCQAEDLAEKKARIYSRLLTEVSLAQEMEELANRHADRKQILQSLITGENLQKEGGMSASNNGGDEE